MIVIAAYPGAAAERGAGHCGGPSPTLRRECEVIRAACEFFGSIRALPSPVSFARALIQLRQKSLSVCAEVLHQFSPFAATCGLVAVPDGHRGSKKEMKCPTSVLKDLTK